MSTLDEKSAAKPITNVLTITCPTTTRLGSNPSIQGLSTIEDIDSAHTLTPSNTSQNEERSLERETSPFSPFYNPAPTRYSLEAQKSESKQSINVIQAAYDTDVEACLTPQKTMASGNTTGLLNGKKANVECTVWPGRRAMRMKKKAMRQERSKNMMCGWISRLDKKVKVWIKVLIALLVIGTAVGVGVGVSRAVGGGVWRSSSNANAPISP
jgi:hypothetical protein